MLRFLYVRPAGRTHLGVRLRPSFAEVKSPTGPVRGTVSRTARVSIVRWNLKEAAGKALA
jgi:hypothetical protein